MTATITLILFWQIMAGNFKNNFTLQITNMADWQGI